VESHVAESSVNGAVGLLLGVDPLLAHKCPQQPSKGHYANLYSQIKMVDDKKQRKEKEKQQT